MSKAIHEQIQVLNFLIGEQEKELRIKMKEHGQRKGTMLERVKELEQALLACD